MIITIEAELDYTIPGGGTVSLQLEAADLPDQRVIESALEMTDAPDPTWIPAGDGIGRRGWVEVGETLKCRYRARVEIDRPMSDIRAARWVPLAELPAETVKYLMPSRYCQSDLFEPFVRSKFDGLEGGAKIAAMRDWIEANFSYVRGSSDETTTVVETFVGRQGVCRDYAHVMITLARAARMPARAVSVYAPDVTPPDFHMIAEVYVGDEWRLIDATGMAQPDTVARMVVGYDAADIDFMNTYGGPDCEPALNSQSVKVLRT
jgi:transglutaminase-like putative cysteine protease